MASSFFFCLFTLYKILMWYECNIQTHSRIFLLFDLLVHFLEVRHHRRCSTQSTPGVRFSVQRHHSLPCMLHGCRRRSPTSLPVGEQRSVSDQFPWHTVRQLWYDGDEWYSWSWTWNEERWKWKNKSISCTWCLWRQKLQLTVVNHKTRRKTLSVTWQVFTSFANLLISKN